MYSSTGTPTVTYFLHDGNQLSAQIAGDGSISEQYVYLDDQRPLRVFKDSTLIAEYAYNSFGERIKKITYRGDQKQVTYFLYEGHKISAQINVEDDAKQYAFSQTIYLQDHPVIQLVGDQTYAVHTDRLGTAHALSNAQGSIAWQAEYSPFGKATVLVEDVIFNLRLPGQYEDRETGTHYNYLRDYDPETGRYLTSDPISINGGLNTYQYANADPLNAVDVLGLAPDLDFSAGETIISGAEFEQLHGYAMAEDGLAYFTLMFELTGHGLYKDFADSYSATITPAAIYLLREVFMRHGTNNITRIICPLDEADALYQIDEMDVFSETVFQAAGIGRGVASFVIESGTGLCVELGYRYGESGIGLHAGSLRRYDEPTVRVLRCASGRTCVVPKLRRCG